MARFRFFRGLHFKIASGVILTIVVTSTLYFVADYRDNRQHLLAELHESADRLATVSLQGLLELAMLGKHPELLQRALERFGSNPSVRSIFLIDLDGVVRFSSRRDVVGRRFDRMQKGCRECHLTPSADLLTSEFVNLDDGEVLRSVSPVPNRPECHACHDSTTRLKGLLVMDFSTDGIWSQLRVDFYESALRAGITALLMLVVLGVLLNKVVIFRLQRLTRAVVQPARSVADVRFPLSESPDEIGQLAGSFGEMTRRVHSSIENLERQQTHLQTLMNSLPDGLIVVDRNCRVELTNQAADRIWDREKLEEILLGGRLFPEVREALGQTLGEGELSTCEIRIESVEAVGAEQGPTILEINGSPVADSSGRIVRAILLVRDITRRRMLEAQVSQADRLASVGRLAAGLAHEINNPMAAVTTCVEGLSRFVTASESIVPPEKAEIEEYLSTVGEAAQRCKEITRRLLSASAGQGPAEFEPIDLRHVVNEAVTLVHHQADRQQVSILSPSNEEDVLVLGDRGKLAQVVLNLLLNSLEAMPGGGNIRIELSSRDGTQCLEISDTGKGIGREDLRHIFDPFFTTKSGGRGTGLGLPISQWIVRQHKGRMQVNSEAGRGSRFSVVIPALEETS